jgi:parafibromin
MNNQQNKPQTSSTTTVLNGVHPTGKPDPRHSTPGSQSISGQGRPQQQKRVSRTPIIVIPATGTALITMYNAQDILQVHLLSFLKLVG